MDAKVYFFRASSIAQKFENNRYSLRCALLGIFKTDMIERLLLKLSPSSYLLGTSLHATHFIRRKY